MFFVCFNSNIWQHCIDDLAVQVWPRTWAGICYANVGGVNINDPDCKVRVGVMLGFAFFSGILHARDLHKKVETMVFEAHGMSFPCAEVLLFNYAKVNTVFHSMASLKYINKLFQSLNYRSTHEGNKKVVNVSLRRSSETVFCLVVHNVIMKLLLSHRQNSVVTRELRTHTWTCFSDANMKRWIEVIRSVCHSITDRNERLR